MKRNKATYLLLVIDCPDDVNMLAHSILTVGQTGCVNTVVDSVGRHDDLEIWLAPGVVCTQCEAEEDPSISELRVAAGNSNNCGTLNLHFFERSLSTGRGSGLHWCKPPNVAPKLH